MKCFSFVPLACLLVAGCGGGSGEVKVTVSYKGKALEYGTVTAIPQGGNGDAVSENIDAEGKCTLKGVAVGKAKFLVVAQNPKVLEDVKKIVFKDKENLKKDGGGRVPTGDAAKVEELMKKASVIPEKYGDSTQEFLTFTVVRGENKYDIELK